MRRTSTLLLCALGLGTNAQLLDPTFAVNGYTQDNDLRGPATCLAVRPDGTIIAGLDQRSYQNWLSDWVRTTAFTADGIQVTSYGTNGICSGFSWGERAVVEQVTTTPDNRTLYIGHSEYCVELVCGLPNILLGRITAAGVVDSTFGVNGLVRANELFGPLVMGSYGEQLIRLDNGKILIAGSVYMQGSYRYVFVARINENGTVDTNFGPNGNGYYTGTYEGNQGCVNMSVDADGNIYVTGQRLNGLHLEGYVTKLDHEGQPVQTFGTLGTATIYLAERVYPRAVDLHGDGRIVVAGQLRNEFGGVQDTIYRPFVVELMPDGSPSPNMPNGYRVVPTPMPGGEFKQIHIMADDRILVAGSTNTGLLMGNNTYQGLIGRLNNDGTWDNTFNNADPYVAYDLSVSSMFTGTFITDFVPLDNGQILASGGRYYQGSLQSALVMRISPEGMNVGLEELSGPSALAVFPDPVASTMNVRFELPAADRITLSLLDPLGRTEHVFLQNAPASGMLTRVFELPSSVANGLHLLSLVTASGERSTVRLVVER
jgi:uncharacterized delta-60 repeat protein